MTAARARFARAQGNSSAKARLGARFAVNVGSQFTPLDLNPVAWFDGTDASTMNTATDGTGSTPGSGGNVGRWESKGQNTWRVEALSSNFPVLTSSGVEYTYTDGDVHEMRPLTVNTRQRFSNLISASPSGGFYVRFSVSGDTDPIAAIVVTSNRGSAAFSGIDVRIDDNNFDVLISHDNAGYSLDSVSYTSGTTATVVVRWDGSAYQISINGGSESAMSAFGTWVGDTESNDEIRLGNFQASTSNNVVTVEQFAVFDSNFTAADAADLHNY